MFVKGGKPSEVKTRLASRMGAESAYAIYQQLISLTEEVTNRVPVDTWILYTGEINTHIWPNADKHRQIGADLGIRMLNAFKKGFENGYEEIVLIGSDLPDLSDIVIKRAFNELSNAEIVLGPAADGGYYLIALSKLHSFIFQNKPWSQSDLLLETLADVKERNLNYVLLETLNDIDTYEDYLNSSLYKKH